MTLVAEGMTVALMGAVVIVAGKQIDDGLQPGHILGSVVIFIGVRRRFWLLVVAEYARGLLAATNDALLGGIAAIRERGHFASRLHVNW